jgi:hypothetical protein
VSSTGLSSGSSWASKAGPPSARLPDHNASSFLARESPARPRLPHAAGRAAARELIAEYEGEHGPLPAASRERARQFLIEAGLIDDEPQRAAG